MRSLNKQHKQVLWDFLGGKPNFSAYGWADVPKLGLKISKNDFWGGWWNEYYSFVVIFPCTAVAKNSIAQIRAIYENLGWDVGDTIGGGISLGFKTLTAEEIDAKAHSNLIHSGRMSD